MLRRGVLVGIAAMLMGASLVFSGSASAQGQEFAGVWETVSNKYKFTLAVTSSYARPGVHRESREVRGEARGGHPNTTSSKRLLQSGGFSGEWDTITDKGNKYVMALLVIDVYWLYSAVIGNYQPLNGTINGTVRGNVLRFRWRQKNGAKGAGRFTLSPDGKTFQGTWSSTDNPNDTSGGTWNGTRKKR